MHALELRRGGGAGGQREQGVREAGALDALLHGLQPSRTLRMAATRGVQREHRVRRHEEHPRTVTQPGIAAGTRLRFLVT